MKKFEFTQETISEIVNHHIKPLVKKPSIFILTGPLGVGKTTLVKEILKQCGVDELITSPTFSYVNTYSTSHATFHHFDLYRISSCDQFIHFGFGELLLDKNSINFIEWPEVIAEIINNPSIKKDIYHLALSYDQERLDLRVLQLNGQTLSE